MLFKFKRIQSRLLVFHFSLLLIVLGPVYFLVNSQNIENALAVITADLDIGAANFDASISNRNESLAIAADALSLNKFMQLMISRQLYLQWKTYYLA